MCTCLQNKFLSSSNKYKNGVKLFLDFSLTNGIKGEKTRCPYNPCKNGYFLKIDEVKYHLLVNGFLENYKVRELYAEKNRTNQAKVLSNNRRTF